jgi:hypothetical protein
MDVVLISSGIRLPQRALTMRHDNPGTALCLMVVATGTRHCIGVDLASGALVRAWSNDDVDARLQPYDLVEVVVAGDEDLLPDPAQPEAISVIGPPRPYGVLTGRPAQRLLRPLLHPENTPLLGSYGPAVPFWERSPDHPSVALAAPEGPLVVTVEGGSLWCHFRWDGRPQVLACSDPRLAASLYRARRAMVSLRPGTHLVVALQPPLEGQCHKVIEALVPKR